MTVELIYLLMNQVIIKTANTTAVTVDSSQNVALAGNLSVTGTITGKSCRKWCIFCLTSQT